MEESRVNEVGKGEPFARSCGVSVPRFEVAEAVVRFIPNPCSRGVGEVVIFNNFTLVVNPTNNNFIVKNRIVMRNFDSAAAICLNDAEEGSRNYFPDIFVYPTREFKFSNCLLLPDFKRTVDDKMSALGILRIFKLFRCRIALAVKCILHISIKHPCVCIKRERRTCADRNFRTGHDHEISACLVLCVLPVHLHFKVIRNGEVDRIGRNGNPHCREGHVTELGAARKYHFSQADAFHAVLSICTIDRLCRIICDFYFRSIGEHNKRFGPVFRDRAIIAYENLIE